jgi:hypothetical protein
LKPLCQQTREAWLQPHVLAAFSLLAGHERLVAQCAAPARCRVERALRPLSSGGALSSNGSSLGFCGTNFPRNALARMAWSSSGRSRDALACSAATRSSHAKAISILRTISSCSAVGAQGTGISDIDPTLKCCCATPTCASLTTAGSAEREYRLPHTCPSLGRRAQRSGPKHNRQM